MDRQVKFILAVMIGISILLAYAVPLESAAMRTGMLSMIAFGIIIFGVMPAIESKVKKMTSCKSLAYDTTVRVIAITIVLALYMLAIIIPFKIFS